MKKLLLLIAAITTLALVTTGCDPKPSDPPVTNPTGEKPADDKAAAGVSGATDDSKTASTTPATKSAGPDKTAATEKRADDATDIKHPQGPEGKDASTKVAATPKEGVEPTKTGK